MSEKMRVTRHNSRGHKHSGSGYNAKHNDRNFDVSKADNIHAARTAKNAYWNLYDGKVYRGDETGSHMSFDDAEKRYYEEHFHEQWAEQQERHKKARNYKRMQTFDEWRSAKRYCPEESYFQIGKVGSHASRDETWKAARAYVKALEDFSRQHNNCFQILDYAFHIDEAVPQLHIRGVWQYQDETGAWNIGQEESLKRAGISLPDPDRKEGQHNNRKMTFDRIMREKLLDICEETGLEIIREPDPDAKHNRSKKKLLADLQHEAEQKVKEADQRLAEIKRDAVQTAQQLQEDEILRLAEQIQAKRKEQAEKQSERVQGTEQEFQDVLQRDRRKTAGKKPSGRGLGD